MPNHRKLAREFTLFDNGYVSGTNSADGHAWSTQCLANDYLEHFYVGYSRTYPDDGDDAMAISNGGALWDAALEKGKIAPRLGRVLRRRARPRSSPSRRTGSRSGRTARTGRTEFKFTRRHRRRRASSPTSTARSIYWPLLQSDQHRADVFIREYEEFSRRGRGARPDDPEPALRPRRGDATRSTRPPAP